MVVKRIRFVDLALASNSGLRVAAPSAAKASSFFPLFAVLLGA